MTPCLADADRPLYYGHRGRSAQFWADDTGAVHVIVYGGVGRVLDLQVCGSAKEAHVLLVGWLGNRVSTG